MQFEEMVKRINELAKKSKSGGLTAEEAQEQSELRRRYIDGFKKNLRSQLDNIRFTDEEEGNAGSKKWKH
ncbi:DUF896 domain-containing protein [Xylanibacillus composti]|uniref:UPF0291 protein XYCOK13_23900 n=1 Tax=Xylanibacillus composti TaxID=1572762 RepID=A0A8J4H4Q8_9BACL|nr:DUF896 domain-containing protein [Xylanibacillus composti]MDT9724253.1 DUF896 domain-containing protein [Xylanibacillus composti]GIQ69566.1 UPF0291 protein [Xylanibacillus composti]